MNLHNAQFLNVIIIILASLPYFKEERTARINTKNQTLFCAARTYGKHAQTPTRLLLAWRTKAQPEGKHKLSTLRPPLLGIPIRFEYPNRYPAILVSFWAVPSICPPGAGKRLCGVLTCPGCPGLFRFSTLQTCTPYRSGAFCSCFCPPARRSRSGWVYYRCRRKSNELISRKAATRGNIGFYERFRIDLPLCCVCVDIVLFSLNFLIAMESSLRL